MIPHSQITFDCLITHYQTMWMNEYCFTSLSAHWDNIATEGSTKPRLCPTLISHDFECFYSAQHHRQHCTLYAWITLYAQPRWQISEPTGNRTLQPQSIRMSHRGRHIMENPLNPPLIQYKLGNLRISHFYILDFVSFPVLTACSLLTTLSGGVCILFYEVTAREVNSG